MAIIICPGCKRGVSDRIGFCPECSYHVGRPADRRFDPKKAKRNPGEWVHLQGKPAGHGDIFGMVGLALGMTALVMALNPERVIENGDPFGEDARTCISRAEETFAEEGFAEMDVLFSAEESAAEAGS